MGNQEASRWSMVADLRLLMAAAWTQSPRQVTLQLALLLLSGVVGGASLLLLIPIVTSIADSDTALTGSLLGSIDLAGTPLPALLALFVLFATGQALIMRTSAINSSKLQQELVDSMRAEAFAALLAARWTFITQRQNTDVISIVTIGASRAGLAFNQVLRGSVTVVLFTATAAIALVVSPAVSAVALVGIALLGLAQSTAIKPAHRFGMLLGERSRQMQATVTNTLDSLRLVRAHDSAGVWKDQLDSSFTDVRQVQIANVRRTSSVTAISSVGLAISASILILVAVWAQVPPPMIVVILLLVARLASQVKQLASTASQLANSLPAVRDLVDLTNAAQSAAEVPDTVATTRSQLQQIPGRSLVEFAEVSFHYGSSGKGVDKVSFAIRSGETTVLTGHSGAGKSTVADLVLGLLSPDSGEILVDGAPLLPSDLAWWRSHVAYVPQESVLVPGTLRDNLAWSVGRAVTDRECSEALAKAAADFATELPDGLDTLLGDRGVRLSGGQRQRVAIARALLRNPAFLILDEATSSLDDSTESDVLQVVTSLIPAVTVLMIAHRKSTVDLATNVITLADGHVVPADGHVVPADGRVVPAGVVVMPADGHVVPAGGHVVPADVVRLPTATQSSPR